MQAQGGGSSIRSDTRQLLQRLFAPAQTTLTAPSMTSELVHELDAPMQAKRCEELV
jgi:hypothetical protein